MCDDTAAAWFSLFGNALVNRVNAPQARAHRQVCRLINKALICFGSGSPTRPCIGASDNPTKLGGRRGDGGAPMVNQRSTGSPRAGSGTGFHRDCLHPGSRESGGIPRLQYQRRSVCPVRAQIVVRRMGLSLAHHACDRSTSNPRCSLRGRSCCQGCAKATPLAAPRPVLRTLASARSRRPTGRPHRLASAPRFGSGLAWRCCGANVFHYAPAAFQLLDDLHSLPSLSPKFRRHDFLRRRRSARPWTDGKVFERMCPCSDPPGP